MQADSVVDGQSDPARDTAWSWCALAVFAGGTAYFVVTRLGSLWSFSVDFALHCVLVDRLMTGEHFAAVDPTMGEMTIYPRVSHAVAAIVGAFVDSPVLGLHIVSLLALIALWGLIALGMTGSGKRAVVLLPVFLIVVLGAQYLHIEMFGNEINGNYFFPQFVGQTALILVLLLVGSFERRGLPPEIRYLFLALCTAALISVHLLPAVEVAGILALSVVVECYADWRPQRAVAGGLALVLAALLTVRNVDFWTMVRLSRINGYLSIRYVPGAAGAAALAVATFAISAAVLYRWAQSDPAHRDERLFLKYLAQFGVACAGLCMAQYVLLVGFDKGSEYAVKKYGFGLDTTLILLAAYAIAAAAPKPLVERLRHRAVPLACIALVPLLLVLSPMFKPKRADIDLDRLTNVERLLRHYHDLALEPEPGKSDYAIGVTGVTGSGDYLLSIVSLHAPRLPNGSALIMSQPLPEPAGVGSVFTTEHSSPWDVPRCRRHRFPNSIVQVDASCVLTAGRSGAQ